MADTSKGAAFGALAALFAGLSCCLPVGTLLAAAGLAGASSVLVAASGWLMLASAALVGVAVVQAWRRRACDTRHSRWSAILAWTSAGFVVFSLLFPQVIAGFIADIAGGARH
jgi:hypothetical protein